MKKHFSPSAFGSFLRSHSIQSESHLVWLLLLLPPTTMKMCSVIPRITNLTGVTLLCLAASSLGVLRGVEARFPSVGTAVSPASPGGSTAQTCELGGNDLQLSGANESFKIKCPNGSKLVPVETAAASQRRPRNGNAPGLDKVYLLGRPSRATPREKQTCDTVKQEKLSKLVPGSELTVDSGPGQKQAAQDEVLAETVFTLRLGDGQQEDKHFCYICTKTSVGRTESSCSIFLTVPKKEDSGTTNPPSGSGSLFPSVIGWLSMSVPGCVLGLTLLP